MNKLKPLLLGVSLVVAGILSGNALLTSEGVTQVFSPQRLCGTEVPLER